MANSRHGEAAEVNGAGLRQPRHDRRGIIRGIVAENLGAEGSDPADAVEHVLVGQRNAVQRTAPVAPRDRGIRPFGGGHGPPGLDRDEAIEQRLNPFGARQARPDELHGRHPAPAQRLGCLGQRHIGQRVAHAAASSESGGRFMCQPVQAW